MLHHTTARIYCQGQKPGPGKTCDLSVLFTFLPRVYVGYLRNVYFPGVWTFVIIVVSLYSLVVYVCVEGYLLFMLYEKLLYCASLLVTTKDLRFIINCLLLQWIVVLFVRIVHLPLAFILAVVILNNVVATIGIPRQ